MAATIPIPRSELEARLGERFRVERKRADVRLRELAETLGVSINTIRWHEYGARMMRADLIVRAAGRMGVEPGVLLEDHYKQQQEQEDAQQPHA
jgi:transcriptional regulator with XRE-family HTH domain